MNAAYVFYGVTKLIVLVALGFAVLIGGAFAVLRMIF